MQVLVKLVIKKLFNKVCYFVCVS